MMDGSLPAGIVGIDTMAFPSLTAVDAISNGQAQDMYHVTTTDHFPYVDFGESMDTSGGSMNMDGHRIMNPMMSTTHPSDIKPDINSLNISTTNPGVPGYNLGNPNSAGPPPPNYMASQGGFNPGSFNSPISTASYASGTSGGLFSMGSNTFSPPTSQMSPAGSSQMSPSNQMQSPMPNSPSLSMGSMQSPSMMSPGSISLQSPTSTMGPPGQGFPGLSQGHISMSTKHICAICGDRASGKHYGVYSCEGCKGFFKRTVRKDLQYACRDDKQCLIDKRQRNRCQYCRYMKCLSTGMKREAVQEERQRNKEKGEGEVESTTTANSEMPVEQILEAEMFVEPKTDTYVDAQRDPVTNICQAADKQLLALVDWAKRVPHFSELPLEDQVILLRAGWNELLISGFSHRSIPVQDGILLSTGLHVHRTTAHQAGVGTIFDRVLTELVAKMREMSMDKTELGCLRAIVLYNPDAKGLSNVVQVETQREKVYASLEEYCKTKHPEEPGRFAKLLLRLPALRSISLKCMEHLFFFKLIGDTPIDSFLMEMLENPNPDCS